MNSDSESQDSDEGRRFRFATTRKDSAPQSTNTPPQPRRPERRSRSRDRSSRYRDSSSYKNRSSSDKDTNNKQLTKDRSSREARSSSRDRSSRRYHEKESRSQKRNHDSKDNKNSSNNKHKSKSKEKHKKKSRDRSREKTSKKREETTKKEKRKVDSDKSEVEENNTPKKQCTEDIDKVNLKNMDKTNDFEKSDFKAISGNTMTDTIPVHKKPKSYFERVVKKNVINDDNYYGPVLPPSLEKAMLNARDNEKSPEKDKQLSNNQIGPALPDSLKVSIISRDDENNKFEEQKEDIKKVEEEKAKNEDNEDEDAFGPALPSHLQRRKIVGPVLPDKFVPTCDEQSLNRNSKSDSDEEDSIDLVGPLPADHPANQDNYIQLQLEYRARKVKEKFMDKTAPEKNKREEWMTELPPAHAIALGLGSIPRKLKSNEGPDMSDRSMWTDTPADKLRKQKEKEENRFVPSQESINNSNKDKGKSDTAVDRKGESLLDMHLKTIKKKKKKLEKEAKELGLSTRKPFNRDEDLQTNRLDQARKKKIFEKASRLNDRFTVGKM